ncbi:hypothetical protein Fot_06720 [Forsythia ovata]|uniref:Uncharacterized protein n=1 Tax=Forsythia ovata TaxID=205694 RepID=A0ABD1WU39_9LAMI
MTCFYFSSVPKLNIRRGGVVDDISTPPLVSRTAAVPEIALPQVPKVMVSISSTVLLALGIIEGVPSVPLSIVPLSPLENFRRPDKKKAVEKRQRQEVARMVIWM